MDTVTLAAETIVPSPYKRVSLKQYNAVVFWDGYNRHLINCPRAAFFGKDGKITIQSFYSDWTVSGRDTDNTIEAVIGEGDSKANYYGVHVS